MPIRSPACILFDNQKKKKKNFFLLFLRKRRNINEFYLVTSLTPAVAFEFWASVWPDFNLCRKLK